MTTTPKRLIFLAILLLLGGACRRSPAPAPESGPVKGGELVASLRSEPGNYNRYFDASAAADLMALLTQARLVRVNRATDALEPALAERWDSSPDGRTQTLHLRKGITFSDGAPFTSADVLFSFAVAYDAPGSRLGDSVTAAGQRLEVTSPDPATVVIRFPVAVRSGRPHPRQPADPARGTSSRPALPNGTIQKAWTPSTPLTEIVGLGPFVLAEHVAGQRLVFARNPHYWRREPAAGGAAVPGPPDRRDHPRSERRGAPPRVRRDRSDVERRHPARTTTRASSASPIRDG